MRVIVGYNKIVITLDCPTQQLQDSYFSFFLNYYKFCRIYGRNPIIKCCEIYNDLQSHPIDRIPIIFMSLSYYIQLLTEIRNTLIKETSFIFNIVKSLLEIMSRV